MQMYIVAVPLASLGINNRKIYGTQGQKQIMALISFCKMDQSLENNLCSGPLFTNNYTSLSNCCTDTCISNKWKLLWEYNLAIEEKQ